MDDLAPRVREFLCTSIAGLWTLELLVLLHDDPTQEWSVEYVQRELRVAYTLVAQRLEHLERLGLVRCEDQVWWQYAPRSDAIATIVDELSAAFRERPFSVANALFAASGHFAGHEIR